jgi:hypothetical protein
VDTRPLLVFKTFLLEDGRSSLKVTRFRFRVFAAKKESGMVSVRPRQQHLLPV